MKKIIFFCLSFLLIIPTGTQATLSDNLKGKILLQVEENGEAWYVHPDTSTRYYMGRPDDAFKLMRELGVGITTKNLNRIPVAEANFLGSDNDEDGLSDAIEDSFGTDKFNQDSDNDGYLDKEEILSNYNPLGPGGMPIDISFSNKQKGKILLQVEAHGEAWYVNPYNSMRYFLGRPADAFDVMRSTGLGISNQDLSNISIDQNSAQAPILNVYNTQDFTFKYHPDLRADIKGLWWPDRYQLHITTAPEDCSICHIPNYSVRVEKTNFPLNEFIPIDTDIPGMTFDDLIASSDFFATKSTIGQHEAYYIELNDLHRMPRYYVKHGGTVVIIELFDPGFTDTDEARKMIETLVFE